MLPICIPSSNRLNKITTIDLFQDYQIFVPEKEWKEYSKVYKNVIAVPDKHYGITKTRNYIIDYMQSDHIQIDDDVMAFQYIEKNKTYLLEDKNEIMFMIENLYQMSIDYGAKLFGLSVNQDSKSYSMFSPFSTISSIYGSFLGIIKSDIRFDERFELKEDFDFFLQHLYHYHKVLRFNKYSLVCKHIQNEGGCFDYRTEDLEKLSVNLLIKKWGDRIIKIQDNKNYCKINSPLRGI